LPAFLPTGYSSQHVQIASTFRSPAFLPTGDSSRHVQIAGFTAKPNTASAGMFSFCRLFCQQDTSADMIRLPAFLPTGYSSQHVQIASTFRIAGFSANRIQQPACSDRRLFCQQDAAAGMIRLPAFQPTGCGSRYDQIAGFSANRMRQPV
jgi:hypothetical protein